ncbi:hypothetical protein HDU98_012262 [Podochytrium sp. JEL0797]|nr:hypothetical protein HDU98_012262 [Podochytrium sp. JEL0797]
MSYTAVPNDSTGDTGDLAELQTVSSSTLVEKAKETQKSASGNGKDSEKLLTTGTLVSIFGSIGCSVALVMVNKLVLNNGFNYASSLTVFHQLVGYTYSSALIFFKVIPPLPEPLPEYRFSRIYIAGLYSAGIVLMNQSLSMNPVAFYQVLKMACIPAIAILQFFLYGKLVSKKIAISLGVILLGVAFATMAPANATKAAVTSVAAAAPTVAHKIGQRATEAVAEATAVPTGMTSFFAGFITLIVSLGAIITTVMGQMEMNASPDLKRLNSLQSMNAMSLISFFVCFVAATFIDMHVTIEDWLRVPLSLIGLNNISFFAQVALIANKFGHFWYILTNEAPLGWIFASCILAIGVNVFGMSLIKGTSAMTYQVVGHLKTVLTLAIGAIMFGANGLDGLRGFGVVIAFAGIVMYSRDKM